MEEKEQTMELEQGEVSNIYGSSSVLQNSTLENTLEEHPPTDFVDQPKGFKLAVILTSLFFSLLLASLDQNIVSTASPTIASQFNALDQIGWITTSYLLPMTAFQPLFGKLSDIFGRKSMLLISISIFLLGSGLSGASQSMTMLCAMRGLQGVGAAGIIPLVMIILGEVMPLEQRGKYQGLVALCWATGTLAGPTVGGVLVDRATWRWIFFLNLPVGTCTMIAIIFSLRNPQANRLEKQDSFCVKLLRIDVVGAILFISGIACFLLATEWAGAKYAWNSAIIISLYCATVGFLALTLVVELYIIKEPFLQLDLFKDKDNVALYAISFLFGCTFSAGIYLFPIYFQIAHGDSPTMSGVELLAFLLPVDITSVLTGFLISATGRYRPILSCGSVFIAVGSGLCTLILHSTSKAMQIVFMAMSGIGVGACIQNVYVAAQANVKSSNISPALSMVSFAEYFGFASGTAISNAIFNNILRKRLFQLGFSEVQIQLAQASPDFVKTAPPELQGSLSDAYLESLRCIFISMAIYGVLNFIGSLILTPKRIKGTEQ